MSTIDPDPTPEEAAVHALRDINATWATWTSGRLDEEDAMAAILTALTFARENGAL